MYWVRRCPSSHVYVLLGPSECDFIWLFGDRVIGDVTSQAVWINTGVSTGVAWALTPVCLGSL